MKRIKSIFPLLVLAFAITACGESNNAETTDQESVNTQPTSPEKAAEKSVADTVRLEIEGNDQMKYNKARLTVTEGQVVVLTLKHVGEMPENAMGHNWVLLKKGVDKASFAEAAIDAKQNDYIPAGMTEDVIAHTEMIGGGETTTVTFTAPRQGIYDYICSFPGHYMNMKGKFIVE